MRKICLRHRLVWAAQSRLEGFNAYSERVQGAFELYVKKGDIAKKELVEIMESEQERESLAIFCYINGLQRAIKRYMCKPEFYSKFRRLGAIRYPLRIRLETVTPQNPLRKDTTSESG